MTESDSNLASARESRNAARGKLDARVAQIKGDLAERSIPGRMLDSVAREASDVAGETLAIARQSPGIIAGTIAAIGLWVFRRPLIAGIGALRNRFLPNRQEH